MICVRPSTPIRPQGSRAGGGGRAARGIGASIGAGLLVALVPSLNCFPLGYNAMSLELWNTFATFGTFLVISATAIAAIVQLRHLRGSNQLAALNELREAAEAPELRAAQHFVTTQLAEKLRDPSFRYQIVNGPARTAENEPSIAHLVTLGNFYESMAVLVKDRLVDRQLLLELWNYSVTYNWVLLAPVTAMNRRKLGNTLWENFEYLTVLSQDWLAAHPNGTYPPGMRRIELKDEWAEADARYAAEQASIT